jgi:hypothetical protein
MTTQPALIAYAVKNRAKGQTAIWTRIGAAWPHSDRKGFSIEMTALPLDGRIVLIEPDEKAAPAEGGAA